MANQSKDGVWERFSRTGVILILIYVLFIILGFSVRLLFFSDQNGSSIIPDNNVVVSAQGNTPQDAASGNSEATNENILELKTDRDFVAVLEGKTTSVSVNMSTVGQACAGDLVWSSEDNSIATVDEQGVVTGVKVGETEIRVAVKGNESISATVPVAVRKLEVVEGKTLIDGILIVNKTYGLPSTYNPGLDSTARAAFEAMSAVAEEDGMDLYIGSEFRSYEDQVRIYENYSDLYGQEAADTFSARPGYSEHQSGYAIDTNTIDDAFGETQEAAWLAEHAPEYGFIIRFPEGKESITGYKYEPWHIRYVGVDAAKEITALGLSLEEYLGVDSVYTPLTNQ